MTVVIEIDESCIPAFNRYLATQVTASVDPVTKEGVLTPHFAGIEDFVRKQIAGTANYVKENF